MHHTYRCHIENEALGLFHDELIVLIFKYQVLAVLQYLWVVLLDSLCHESVLSEYFEEFHAVGKDLGALHTFEHGPIFIE